MSGPTPLHWSPSVANGPTGRSPGTRRVIWFGGVVLVLIGSFLPWLRSGRVQRNSYELAGVGVRRLQVADWVELPLRAWPFLGILWGVAVALLILGRARSAGILATALGAVTALVALGGLYLAVRLDSFLVSGLFVGPVVTAAGATAVLLTSVPMARRRRDDPASHATNHPPGAVG